MISEGFTLKLLDILDKKTEEGATKLEELDVTSPEYSRTLENIQASLMFSGQIRQVALEMQKKQNTNLIKFDEKK